MSVATELCVLLYTELYPLVLKEHSRMIFQNPRILSFTAGNFMLDNYYNTTVK